MIYTWNNKTVDVYPTLDGNSDVIFNVHWKLVGENENGVSGITYGTQALETSNISDFTIFSNITEQQINSWVEEYLGEEKIIELKENINAQIENKINPTVVTKVIGE